MLGAMRIMHTARLVSGALVALAACGGPPSVSVDGGAADQVDADICQDGLCLAPPAQGFQVRTQGATIEPGQDVEYCEVVQLPGTPDDVYYVNGFDAAMTTGSHHLIVTAAEVGSPTEANATPGERVECLTASVFGDELLPVTGSQQPLHSEAYPAGVGRIFHGGQRVIFDYHYFNSTDGALLARAAVNFKTTDASQVTNLARSFGFYNVAISIPVGETAAFTGECTFDQDIVVHKLTRHTHQWGTTFRVWYVGGPHDGEEVFLSESWDDVDRILAEPVTMPAGTGFRFECAYQNTSDHHLAFGTDATDEMCILFGTWWTPVPGAPATSQSCLITN
jgi:hypothetical protein